MKNDNTERKNMENENENNTEAAQALPSSFGCLARLVSWVLPMRYIHKTEDIYEEKSWGAKICYGESHEQKRIWKWQKLPDGWEEGKSILFN